MEMLNMVSEDTIKNHSLDGIELLEYVIEKQKQRIAELSQGVGALKDKITLDVENEYQENHPASLSNAEKRKYEVNRRLEEDPAYKEMKEAIELIRVQLTYDDIHVRAMKRDFIMKFGPLQMAI
jgi:ABC-type lipopolysaccharide export system ATPase subunit